MLKPYLIFFIPFIIAWLLKDIPVASFLIAWLGSFFIFYKVWIVDAKFFTDGLSVANRIMRPMFLLQAIFVGYMCVTSIFYFYELLATSSQINNHNELLLTAKSQRMAYLCHIALVFGMISFSEKKTAVYKKIYSGDFYFKLAIFSLLLTFLFRFIPGLSQFELYFNLIFSMSTVYIFYCGLRDRIFIQQVIGLAGFVISMFAASLTGMKEPIIMNVIILSLLIYPLYKKTVIILAVPTLVVLFYFLPSYANIMRSQAWTGEISNEEARSLAIEELLSDNNEEQIAQTSWDFLTNRISEIGMVNQFVDFVPAKRDYYHFEIINNSLAALIPRALWPTKPITEKVSMQRVYDAGITSENSTVSAKTRPYIDGYLSFGFIGAFVVMFVYGAFAQWACNKAEQYFKSYELGCIVIFNSCLSSLWHGSNLEFLINNMCYGFLTIWLIHQLFKKLAILK